jgi:hypothetical protein
MKTTVLLLLHYEQLLEIDTNIGAEVVAMMEIIAAAVIVEASIEILVMQHNSK